MYPNQCSPQYQSRFPHPIYGQDPVQAQSFVNNGQHVSAINQTASSGIYHNGTWYNAQQLGYPQMVNQEAQQVQHVQHVPKKPVPGYSYQPMQLQPQPQPQPQPAYPIAYRPIAPNTTDPSAYVYQAYSVQPGHAAPMTMANGNAPDQPQPVRLLPVVGAAHSFNSQQGYNYPQQSLVGQPQIQPSPAPQPIIIMPQPAEAYSPYPTAYGLQPAPHQFQAAPQQVVPYAPQQHNYAVNNEGVVYQPGQQAPLQVMPQYVQQQGVPYAPPQQGYPVPNALGGLAYQQGQQAPQQVAPQYAQPGEPGAWGVEYPQGQPVPQAPAQMQEVVQQSRAVAPQGEPGEAVGVEYQPPAQIPETVQQNAAAAPQGDQQCSYQVTNKVVGVEYQEPAQIPESVQQNAAAAPQGDQQGSYQVTNEVVGVEYQQGQQAPQAPAQSTQVESAPDAATPQAKSNANGPYRYQMMQAGSESIKLPESVKIPAVPQEQASVVNPVGSEPNVQEIDISPTADVYIIRTNEKLVITYYATCESDAPSDPATEEQTASKSTASPGSQTQQETDQATVAAPTEAAPVAAATTEVATAEVAIPATPTDVAPKGAAQEIGKPNQAPASKSQSPTASRLTAGNGGKQTLPGFEAFNVINKATLNDSSRAARKPQQQAKSNGCPMVAANKNSDGHKQFRAPRRVMQAASKQSCIPQPCNLQSCIQQSSNQQSCIQQSCNQQPCNQQPLTEAHMPETLIPDENNNTPVVVIPSHPNPPMPQDAPSVVPGEESKAEQFAWKFQSQENVKYYPISAKLTDQGYSKPRKLAWKMPSPLNADYVKPPTGPTLSKLAEQGNPKMPPKAEKPAWKMGNQTNAEAVKPPTDATSAKLTAAPVNPKPEWNLPTQENAKISPTSTKSTASQTNGETVKPATGPPKTLPKVEQPTWKAPGPESEPSKANPRKLTLKFPCLEGAESVKQWPPIDKSKILVAEASQEFPKLPGQAKTKCGQQQMPNQVIGKQSIQETADFKTKLPSRTSQKKLKLAYQARRNAAQHATQAQTQLQTQLPPETPKSNQNFVSKLATVDTPQIPTTTKASNKTEKVAAAAAPTKAKSRLPDKSEIVNVEKKSNNILSKPNQSLAATKEKGKPTKMANNNGCPTPEMPEKSKSPVDPKKTQAVPETTVDKESDEVAVPTTSKKETNKSKAKKRGKLDEMLQNAVSDNTNTIQPFSSQQPSGSKKKAPKMSKLERKTLRRVKAENQREAETQPVEVELVTEMEPKSEPTNVQTIEDHKKTLISVIPDEKVRQTFLMIIEKVNKL